MTRRMSPTSGRGGGAAGPCAAISSPGIDRRRRQALWRDGAMVEVEKSPRSDRVAAVAAHQKSFEAELSPGRSKTEGDDRPDKGTQRGPGLGGSRCRRCKGM
jgi:hypothetical protein